MSSHDMIASDSGTLSDLIISAIVQSVQLFDVQHTHTH